MESLSHKIAKGAAWMVAFKLVERSIGLVSTIILARLLQPGDFGLVAMATSFIGLLGLLTSFSFDVALIQKPNPSRSLYDTAWTFNVIFASFLALATGLSAMPLANFYDESRLEDILYVMSIGTFLGGFSNIGPVAFRKDLQFHKEFYFLLTKKLVSFTVCMSFAFTMRNYWALIWGSFAGGLLEILLSYWVHPFRPRFSLLERKELFKFSIWLFINNGIFFLYNRFSDFLITKLMGSHALGVYSIAYEISNLPTNEMVAPINRAVMPGFSKISADIELLKRGFLVVLSIIGLCAIPSGVGIALLAEPFVNVLLGVKWFETVSLIEVLAFSGILSALQTNIGVVYISLGKPKIITFIAFFQVFLILIPLLFFFMKAQGLIGIGYAYLVTNGFLLFVNYFIISIELGIRCFSFISILWRPVLSVTSMWFLLRYLKTNFWSVDDEALYLFFYVLIGAFVYIFTIMFLWFLSGKPNGAEKFILNKIGVLSDFNV